MKRVREAFSSKEVLWLAEGYRRRVALQVRYNPSDRARFRRFVAREARMLRFAADCIEILTDGTPHGIEQFRRLRIPTGRPW